jgi:hypothetical protein
VSSSQQPRQTDHGGDGRRVRRVRRFGSDTSPGTGVGDSTLGPSLSRAGIEGGGGVELGTAGAAVVASG